jgi:hypothetical protein
MFRLISAAIIENSERACLCLACGEDGISGDESNALLSKMEEGAWLR